jgi:hypothetical protein
VPPQDKDIQTSILGRVDVVGEEATSADFGADNVSDIEAVV